MRISDWSSDVCSSDLAELVAQALFRRVDHHAVVYVEHQLANLGEAPDRARRQAPRVQLLDLAVVVDDEFVKRFGYGWIVSRSEVRRVGKECVSTGRFRW